MSLTARTGPGALACAACCALPVLFAAGVPSGTGAAVLADRVPLDAVILAVTAVAISAFAAWRPGCGVGGLIFEST